MPGSGKESCLLGPAAGPSTLLDTLTTLRASTGLAPGSLRKLGSLTCRDWYFVPRSGVVRGLICVDDSDHLPYQLRLGDLSVRYSDWNFPRIVPPPVLPDLEQLR